MQQLDNVDVFNINECEICGEHVGTVIVTGRDIMEGTGFCSFCPVCNAAFRKSARFSLYKWIAKLLTRNEVTEHKKYKCNKCLDTGMFAELPCQLCNKDAWKGKE
jgi:hypothetical protein